MSIAVAILVTVGAVALAMAAMLLARRLAPPEGFLGSPEPNHTGSALAALGTGFAILTAFVLLLAVAHAGPFVGDHRAGVADQLALEHASGGAGEQTGHVVLLL